MPVAIHHRDFDACAKSRVQSDRRARASGRSEQQVAKIAGEDANGFILGEAPKAHANVDGQMQFDFCAPSPSHGFKQPAIAEPSAIRDRISLRDLAFVAACAGRRFGERFEIENLLLLAAKQRQNAVRRQFRKGLREVEIIRELRSRRFLAFTDFGFQRALRPIDFTQTADQIGVLGKSLDKNGARALKRGVDAGDIFLRVDEGLGENFGIALRICEQLIGERREA